jgi:hypothetical protein
VKPCLENKLSVVAFTPTTKEAEIGGLQSKASLGKSTRPYLKNKQKTKGLRL